MSPELEALFKEMKNAFMHGHFAVALKVATAIMNRDEELNQIQIDRLVWTKNQCVEEMEKQNASKI